MHLPKPSAGALQPVDMVHRALARYPLARRRASWAHEGDRSATTDDTESLADGPAAAAEPDQVLAALRLPAKRPSLAWARSSIGAAELRIITLPEAGPNNVAAASSQPSSAVSTPSEPPLTPTPDGTKTQSWEMPHYAKVAGWALDLPLPGGPSAADVASGARMLPSGARLAPAPGGGWALMLATARSSHDLTALAQIFAFGFSSNATCLKGDGTGALVRARNRGQATKVHAGTYAFVIDQSGDLLLSLTANIRGVGPAGAHRSLAAGLPVRFAGELTVTDGRISRFTPSSGNYLTPPELLGQARAHPLLAAVPLHLPEALGAAAKEFAAADGALARRKV